MTAALVLTVIYHLHVADGIRYDVAQCLVVSLGRELEPLVVHAETVVVTGDEMDASLALDLLVE